MEDNILTVQITHADAPRANEHYHAHASQVKERFTNLPVDISDNAFSYIEWQEDLTKITIAFESYWAEPDVDDIPLEAALETEAALATMAYSEGYDAGFHGRPRDNPYNGEQGSVHDMVDWQRGYQEGKADAETEAALANEADYMNPAEAVQGLVRRSMTEAVQVPPPQPHPYDQGYQAGLVDRFPGVFPYPAGSYEAVAWSCGYWQAQRDQDAVQPRVSPETADVAEVVWQYLGTEDLAKIAHALEQLYTDELAIGLAESIHDYVHGPECGDRDRRQFDHFLATFRCYDALPEPPKIAEDADEERAEYERGYAVGITGPMRDDLRARYTSTNWHRGYREGLNDYIKHQAEPVEHWGIAETIWHHTEDPV